MESILVSQAEIGDLLAFQKKLSTTPVSNSLAGSARSPLSYFPRSAGVWAAAPGTQQMLVTLLPRDEHGGSDFCAEALVVYMPSIPTNIWWGCLCKPISLSRAGWGPCKQTVSCPGLYGENKELAGMLSYWYRGGLRSLEKENLSFLSSISDSCLHYFFWKRSVFIPIPKKGSDKECLNYHTIALISHASKVMLKILTLSDPVDCSLPGSSVHGIFQARVLEWFFTLNII